MHGISCWDRDGSETIGQDQYSKFVDELLSKVVTPVTDPLPKNKRSFLATQQCKDIRKEVYSAAVVWKNLVSHVLHILR